MAEPSYIRVAAKLSNLSIIRGFIRLTGVTLGADREGISDVVVAVDELATNVVVHGYKEDDGIIEVEVMRENDDLVIVMSDNAPAFNPTNLPDPDTSIPLEDRPIGGVGVFLAKQAMDTFDYETLPTGGNRLTLTKRI